MDPQQWKTYFDEWNEGWIIIDDPGPISTIYHLYILNDLFPFHLLINLSAWPRHQPRQPEP